MKRCLMVGLLLILFVFLTSCTPATEDANGEPVVEPVEPLTISEIVLRPEGQPGPEGTLRVPVEISLVVEAPQAEQVDFYYYPEGQEDAARLAGQGQGNEDGWWQLLWEVPEPGVVFTVEARARRGEEIQVSALQLTREDLAVAVPVSQRGTVARLDQLPDYFMARGWINENNILGQSGINLFTYNLERNAYRSLNITAWEVHLSPDKNQLSLVKEGGVYLGSLEETGQRFLWPLERDEQLDISGIRGGVFSPDGSTMLVWNEHEWDTDFFLVAPPAGDAVPLDTSLEGYFLTSFVGWADNNTLVFATRASRKKDGTREYSTGYRSDLAVYKIDTGRFNLITAADDGEFWEGLAVGEEGVLFQRQFPDNGRQTSGLISLDSTVLWEENLGRVLAADLTADGLKAAFLVEGMADQDDAAGEGINWPARLLVWEDDTLSLVADLSVGDSMTRPYWSPTGQQLLFSHTLTEPGNIAGTFRQNYVTLVIEDL